VTTGYLQQYEIYGYDRLLELVKQGVNYNQRNANPEATVIRNSDRFAIVEITAPDHESVYEKDGQTTTRMNNQSGYAYLKRMPNTNEWKIYDIYHPE
jgi:hypothetical protein